MGEFMRQTGTSPVGIAPTLASDCCQLGSHVCVRLRVMPSCSAPSAYCSTPLFTPATVRGQTICTKFAPLPWRQTPDSLVGACRKSLGRLGVQQVGLYIQHCELRYYCCNLCSVGIGDKLACRPSLGRLGVSQSGRPRHPAL